MANDSKKSEDMLSYCRGLVGRLEEASSPAELLKEESLEHYYWAEDDELKALEEKYERLPFVWQLCAMTLEKLCQQDLPEDEFYKRLADLLLRSGLFGEGDERALALFCVLSNSRIPYRQFSHGEMPDDEFESRLDANQLGLRHLKQIAMRSFSQKTQQAHAAWEVLSQATDQGDRDVLLAMLLSFVKD